VTGRPRYPDRLDPDRTGTEWTWAIAGFLLVLALAVLQFGASENGLLRGLSLGLAVALAMIWVVRRRRDEHEKARRAVEDERLRIARELHDVVAHHVSLMGIQAAAARRVMTSRPDEAAAALLAIEASSREATAEMQRLLGMLRSEGPDDLDGQLGLDHVDVLVDRARSAGMTAELAVDGERPSDLAGILDRSAFRIVQEALTNAVKHAPGAHVAIAVRYRPGVVELDIANGAGRPDRQGGGDTAGGHGLIGMRERAALFGGDLRAGPSADGGWRVHATLPTTMASPTSGMRS
jgi:signal transduction histidine kinase